MSQKQIYQALLNAITGVPGMIPVSTAGSTFIPPANAPYADVTHIPNTPVAYTLGDDGDDRHDGFIQVLLKYPLTGGVLGLMQLGDTLRESFKAGHRVFYEGQEVIIIGSGLGLNSEVDGRLANPFTIYWYAFTRR